MARARCPCWRAWPGSPARVAGGGQAVVGAGLLVAVAGAAGQGERGGVLVAGLAGLAGGQQGLPGAVERVGFPVAVTNLLAQGQRLLVVTGGLGVVALPVVDRTQAGQRPAITGPVTGPSAGPGAGPAGGTAGPRHPAGAGRT